MLVRNKKKRDFGGKKKMETKCVTLVVTTKFIGHRNLIMSTIDTFTYVLVKCYG